MSEGGSGDTVKVQKDVRYLYWFANFATLNNFSKQTITATLFRILDTGFAFLNTITMTNGMIFLNFLVPDLTPTALLPFRVCRFGTSLPAQPETSKTSILRSEPVPFEYGNRPHLYQIYQFCKYLIYKYSLYLSDIYIYNFV